MNDKSEIIPSNDAIENKSSHLVGLKNQGATCYLNCVLQSLFHLPAFRYGVYEKYFDNDRNNQKKSIILQLQILFRSLQTSDNSSISTKTLTKAFGWGSNFLKMQQDPHFFLHWLLADALMPDLKNVIDDLFGGKIRTTIHGSKENQIKLVDENFYDLSMIVKDCSSLTESFSKYIELEEINQYIFSPQKDFSNATIKTTFIKMPKILYLHLKRSEYNYVNRKINSYFSFPTILDISPYLDSQNEHVGSTKYELFGVIVHHGSTAIGGHYYSFLRTSKKNEWFKFNDSLVLNSTEKEAINNNFGGENDDFLKGTHSFKSYSAYMLIYIQQCQINYVFENKSNIPIPENIMKLKAEKDQDEKIIFSLFNEESFIANSAKSCLNLTERGYYERISIASRKPINYFYKKIAKIHGIDIGSFRIWILNEHYQFYSILDGSSSSEVSTIKFRNLFLDVSHLDSQNADNLSNKKIIFVFFYFRVMIYPIRYLFSIILNENDTLKNILPKLNKVLNTNQNNIKNTICYEYFQSGNFGSVHLNKVDFSKESIEIINGSCFIFQYNSNKDLSHAPLYQPLHYSSSNDIYLIEKIRYKPFSNAIEYFNNLSETCLFEFADNFHFSAMHNLLCPSKFHLRYFLELISQITQFEKYQLFAKRIQNPIEIFKFETIGQLFDYIVKNNGNHIPLLFISTILEQDIIPINVIISYDAIHPSNYERLFVKQSNTLTYKDILNMLTKKLDESYSKSEIRVVAIKNKMIETINNIDHPCNFGADWIRFEIIPIEQRVKFAKNVEKLCQCRFVGEVNKIEELPFLFVINNTDTLRLLKEKMIELQVISEDSEIYLIQKKKRVQINENEVIFSYIDITSVILIRL